MRRCTVDTNVPVVANGRSDRGHGGKPASIDCRIAAVEFLQMVIASGVVLLDVGGEIQAEYHRHLNPHGQPGVGDQFYLTIINSSPNVVERCDLPKQTNGEYVHLPEDLICANFDPSDRKFAALAAKEGARVMNATDSDWWHHRGLLSALGIEVEFLCGCDPTKWFDAATGPARAGSSGRRRPTFRGGANKARHGWRDGLGSRCRSAPSISASCSVPSTSD